MDRRHFVVGAAAATLAPFALASSGKTQTSRQEGSEWFTNVKVTAHDGRTFRFYDDLLKARSSSSISSTPNATRSAR